MRRAQVLIRNAERTIRGLKVAKGGGVFRAPKRVREASAVGWLAVEEAIKALARAKGIPKEKLPKQIDGLGQMLSEFPEMDGRAVGELQQAYGALHVLGYYEGVHSVKEIVGGLEAAKSLVHRVERRFEREPAQASR